MEENGSSKRSRQSHEIGEIKEESVMEEHGGSKANTGVMEDEEAPAVDDGIPEETRNLSILPGEIRYQYRFHFQVFTSEKKRGTSLLSQFHRPFLGGMHVHVMSSPEILNVKSIWFGYISRHCNLAYLVIFSISNIDLTKLKFLKHRTSLSSLIIFFFIYFNSGPRVDSNCEPFRVTFSRVSPQPPSATASVETSGDNSFNIIKNFSVQIETFCQQAVLRIWDVYPGSEFFLSRILGQKDSRIRIIEFTYFNPKNGF